MNFLLFSHTVETTHKIGKILGEVLDKIPEKQFFLAIHGDLGSGKTLFVQGLAQGLGIKEIPTSPTFAIMEEYPPLLHIDFYRIEEEELEPLGIEEQIELWQGVVAIEWAEKFLHIIPKRRVEIAISIDDHRRVFSISSDYPTEWLQLWKDKTQSFSSSP